jgi:hypothetical protein
MPYDEQEIEQLLAHGHLSGRAYDEIENRIMQRVAPRPASARFHWLLAAAVPMVAALGGLVFYVGVASKEPHSLTSKEPSARGGFAAKGRETSVAGAVELRCSSERACRVGDTLFFLVDTGIASGHLSASAQRITPPSPERIQFFPTQSGERPYLDAGGGTIVVDKGVRLQKALGPGVYQVDVRWTGAATSPDPSAEHGTSVELRIDE